MIIFESFKFYIITIVISVICIIPSLIYDCRILDVLSGVGCSGLAAAMMAIFLEIGKNNQEIQKRQKAKTLYFRRLNDQLTMIIERILWLNDRLDDEKFDWGLEESVYSSLEYMVGQSKIYPDKAITYEDAI